MPKFQIQFQMTEIILFQILVIEIYLEFGV